MGYYSHDIDDKLFLYALQNNNTLFMQQALLMGAFDPCVFKNDEVIKWMMIFLEEGNKTNYILNVLMLSDVTLWKNLHINKLVEMFNNFTEESFDENRLLLSNNPLMSITLTADLLTKIAKSKRRF